MLDRFPLSRRVLALLTVMTAAAALTAVSALASSAPAVNVRDNYFSVKHLTVNRGTRVSWKWAGVLYHNVSVRSGPSRFHSRTQVLGSFSHLFTARGTYSLYCTLHKSMRMTVVVR